MTQTITIRGLSITFPDDLTLVLDAEGVRLTRAVNGSQVTREFVQQLVSHNAVPPAPPVAKGPAPKAKAAGKQKKLLTGVSNPETKSTLIPGDASERIVAALRAAGGRTSARTLSVKVLGPGAKRRLPWYAGKQVLHHLAGMVNRGEIEVEAHDPNQRGSIRFYRLPGTPAAGKQDANKDANG